jgi:hypothetical protein
MLESRSIAVAARVQPMGTVPRDGELSKGPVHVIAEEAPEPLGVQAAELPGPAARSTPIRSGSTTILSAVYGSRRSKGSMGQRDLVQTVAL